MCKRLLSLGFLIGLLIFSSCKDQSKSGSPSSKEGERFVQDSVLNAYFQELYKQGMFNGAVAVKKEGKLILKKGYGKANFEYNADFSPETQMEVASVSKQFTAAAILILQQEGKLKVEEKARQYLGDDYPYSEITIEQLLTHTSGLKDYTPYFRAHWDSTKVAYNNDILQYFKTEKPDLETVPGEHYKYSNSGYITLAEIVEAASGQSLEEFLKARIFQPAGMNSSTFYERDTIWKIKEYAPGYMPELKTCQYTKPEELPGKYYYAFLSGRLGSGRLTSTVEDLLKWDSLLYRNDILTQKSKAQAFRVHKPKKDTSDYGFGWHTYTDKSLGKEVFHTGSWAGNLAFIKRYLDNEGLIVILNNTYSPYMKEIRDQVEAYLKGETPEIPKQKLEYRLQRALCDLDEEAVIPWYEERADEVAVDMKALENLEKEYRKMNEDKKANGVKSLETYIRKQE